MYCSDQHLEKQWHVSSRPVTFTVSRPNVLTEVLETPYFTNDKRKNSTQGCIWSHILFFFLCKDLFLGQSFCLKTDVKKATVFHYSVKSGHILSSLEFSLELWLSRGADQWEGGRGGRDGTYIYKYQDFLKKPDIFQSLQLQGATGLIVLPINNMREDK